MSSFHIYALYRDANRHHCICVAIERKFTYFIPMEAAVVRVAQLEHREFGLAYELVMEYPVRRAAEIFLAAPDKEVDPRAREHLESILADPAYVYDSSQFSVPNVIKENQMAKKNAAAVAQEIADKAPKNKKEALAAAAVAVDKQAPHPEVKAGKPAAAAKGAVKGKAPAAAPAKPAAKAPAKKAAKADEAPAARGRAPAVDPTARLKVGDDSTVKRGFMLAFVNAAKALEKASRGKGFTSEQIISAGAALEEAEGHDEAWVKTYVSYALAPTRGIFVVA